MAPLKPLKPILKWAGGKSRALPVLLGHFPPLTAFSHYIEPFVGGGAVFWHVRSEHPTIKTTISDSNEHLITFYRALRDRPGQLTEAALVHQLLHSPEQFVIAKQRLQNDNRLARAAAMWYLNQSCFNGLWRVNRNGEFNTPWGKRKSVSVNFQAHADAMKGAHIACAGYQQTLAIAGAGSLVYCDPPYQSLDDKRGNFTGYSATSFGFEQHDDLLRCATEAARRGATVFISNSDTPLMRELYEGHDIFEISGKRSIAADPTKRVAAPELLVRVVA